MAIGMRRKKRGMFGSPMGMPNPQGTPITPQGGGFDMGQGMSMDEPEKPGLGTRLLGEGWGAKLAALGSALQGDTGAIANYHYGQQQMKAQSAALAERQRMASQARMDDRADFVFEQDYKNANRPEPTATALQRDYKWLEANHPEMAQQYLTNKVTAPPVVMTNADGTKTIYPAGSIPRGGGAPKAPKGKLKPVGQAKPAGGASSNAGGGF